MARRGLLLRTVGDTNSDTNANAECDTHSDAYTWTYPAQRLGAPSAGETYGGSFLDWGDLGQYRRLPRWCADRDGTDHGYLYRFHPCPGRQRPLHLQGVRSGHTELLQ